MKNVKLRIFKVLYIYIYIFIFLLFSSKTIKIGESEIIIIKKRKFVFFLWNIHINMHG